MSPSRTSRRAPSRERAPPARNPTNARAEPGSASQRCTSDTTTVIGAEPEPPGSASEGSLLRLIVERLEAVLLHFLPEVLPADPESLRRARLLALCRLEDAPYVDPLR